MIKDKNTIEKEINDWLNVKYKEKTSLGRSEDAGYKSYGLGWATVVSIDIVDFKKIVEKNNNERITKIIQLFTKILSEAAKEFNSYRDVYFAGDEVIVIFNGSKKENITEAVNFSFYANSLINTILSTKIKNKYQINLSSGIGVWTSNDNSLVMVGHRYSKDTTTTLIGGAINKASYLAKKANRRKGNVQYPAILMNNTTYTNTLGDQKESIKKWMKLYSSEFNEKIWGGNIVKTNYK